MSARTIGRLRSVVLLLSAVLLASAGTALRANAQSQVVPRLTLVISVAGTPPPDVGYSAIVTCTPPVGIKALPTPQTIPLSFGPGGGSQTFQYGSGYTCNVTDLRPTATPAGFTYTVSPPQQINNTTLGYTFTWAPGRGTQTTAPPVTPLLSVDPVDFGNVLVGETITKQTNVRNVGTIAVNVTRALTSAPFSVSAPNGCSLQPGASCTLDVTFTSRAVGSFQAQLTVNGLGTNSANATGIGLLSASTGDRAEVSLSSVSFPPTEVGQTSKGEAELSNTGSIPYRVGSGVTAPPFFVTGSDCPVLLQTGQRCRIHVEFRPTAGGPANGSLKVPLVGPTNLDATGALWGNASAPPAESIAFQPGNVAIPDFAVGDAAPPISVKLVNTGPVPVTIADLGALQTIAATKKKPASTKIVALTGAVKLAGKCKGLTLQPGASCDLVLTSSTAAGGSRNVTIRALTRSGTVADLPVTGKVLKRGLTATPAVPLGLLDATTPRTGVVTVTNVGEVPTVIATVVLGAGATSGISITADTCSKATLPPKGTCKVTVQGVLKQQAAGAAVTDTLTITGTAKETAKSRINARSPKRALAITPNPQTFGPLVLGGHVEKTVAVRNAGDLPVTIQDVVIQGAAPGDFGWLGAPTCIGTVLKPGAQCVVSITSAPTLTGTRTGTVTVTGTSGEKAAGALRAVVRDRTSTTTTAAPATTAPPTTVAVTTTAPPAPKCAPGVALAFTKRTSELGRPAVYQGTGFGAGQKVTLAWPGRDAWTVTADGSGSIRGSFVLLPHGATGERELVATVDGEQCAAARLLITLPTATPRRPDPRRPVYR